MLSLAVGSGFLALKKLCKQTYGCLNVYAVAFWYMDLRVVKTYNEQNPMHSHCNDISLSKDGLMWFLGKQKRLLLQQNTVFYPLDGKCFF